MQVAVRVAPDEGEVVAVDGVEGGDGHAAVAADDDRVGGHLRGDHGADALQRAQPVHAGVQRLTGLQRNIEHGGGVARQVAGDRGGAVDEEHRTSGGRTLPLRNDEESGHEDSPPSR